MQAWILRPGHPEGKGIVERNNDYLETSFLPGRRFGDIDDFNAQLAGWLERANARRHRTTRARPSERIAEDRAAMIALPPVLPEVDWRAQMRIGRDHYVRVDTCDYSVDPRAIGLRAEVRMDLGAVVVRAGGQEVARHARSLCPHRTITDPRHDELRRRLQAGAGATAAPRPGPAGVEVEERDPKSYDRLLEEVAS
jgi:hypothetical protein